MIKDSHPLNVIKFCPKCGHNQFLSSDEGHSFRCELCHFNYFINSSAAVACLIFNPKGELLLARRAIEPHLGMLDLPGGFVDPLEKIETAVSREIKEELDVRVTSMSYLTSFPNEYVFSGFSVFTVDLAFVCQVDDMSKIKPQDDISSVEFYFPEEIPMQELAADSMRNIIKTYIDQK